MAWGPKPKLLSEITRRVNIAGKVVTIRATRTSRKMPTRSPYGGTVRGKWTEYVFTRARADIYPDCEWAPEVDGNRRYASASMCGWEAKTPEFPIIDEIVDAMVAELKGWDWDETVDQVIARLGVANG